MFSDLYTLGFWKPNAAVFMLIFSLMIACRELWFAWKTGVSLSVGYSEVVLLKRALFFLMKTRGPFQIYKTDTSVDADHC